MCGRYTNHASWAEIVAFSRLPIAVPEQPIEPRYNIAPTTRAWVLKAAGGELSPALMRWGLAPPWAERPAASYSMFNARSDTVSTKPAYRSAFRHRRCLVPATGYYEWLALGREKIPYHFHFPDFAPLFFAGIWEQRVEEDVVLASFAIITDAASAALANYHDRRPVILPPDQHERWLTAPAADAIDVLASTPQAELVATRVSQRVNSARNEGPSLIEPKLGAT